MTLLFANPTEVLLELSGNLLDPEQQTGASGGYPWRRSLNQSCFEAVLAWLHAEGATNASGAFPDSVQQGLWEIIEGSAIAIANTRIILIPSEAIDDEELRVAQEWVDIAAWTGDYYIAAQVNPDTQNTRLWAWTTHYQLKTAGYYDAGDRTYSLSHEALYTDMSAFWVAQEIGCVAIQADTMALATLESRQAENLIERLGNPEVIFPRREVPFSLWGALMSESQWRDRLLQKRMGAGDIRINTANLRDWWEDRIIAGWQRLENLNFPNLALNTRDRAIAGTMIRRLKVMTLATYPPQTVALLMSVGSTEDERLSVSVRLHPEPGRDLIPAGIKLELLSLAGEPFKTVEAREQDNYIQIPRFKCPPGFNFAVRVQLGEVEELEYFNA